MSAKSGQDPPQRAGVEVDHPVHTPCPFELLHPITEQNAKALSGICSAKAGPESAGHTILK